MWINSKTKSTSDIKSQMNNLFFFVYSWRLQKLLAHAFSCIFQFFGIPHILNAYKQTTLERKKNNRTLSAPLFKAFMSVDMLNIQRRRNACLFYFHLNFFPLPFFFCWCTFSQRRPKAAVQVCSGTRCCSQCCVAAVFSVAFLLFFFVHSKRIPWIWFLLFSPHFMDK